MATIAAFSGALSRPGYTAVEMPLASEMVDMVNLRATGYHMNDYIAVGGPFRSSTKTISIVFPGSTTTVAQHGATAFRPTLSACPSPP